MTRQDFLKKWTFYALALLLTAFLQALVFSRLRLFGFIPVLLPAALSALATLEGPASGAGFGIAVGILSMYVDGESAWVILLASAGGLAAGLLARYVLRQDFVGHVICTAGLLAVRMLYYFLSHLAGGAAPVSVLLGVALPEFLWSMAFSPVIYLLFRFVYRRWGSAYYA